MSPPKSIITGIDFSECSLNALEYAAALCSYLGASLVVVHASNGITREETVPDMLTVLSSLRERFPQLEVLDILGKDEPTTEILAAAEKFAPEYIVVGTQGVHEAPDVFIGSTTGALIKLGKAPVLVIPPGSVFTPYKHILFAVKNPYVASKEILLPFLTLTHSCSPKVDLLHVTRDSMPDLSNFPDPYYITPHTHVQHKSESDNIYHSVEEYLKDGQTDLLVVVNRLRGFFEGLFAQSSASTNLFHSELPILVLHGGQRN